jgi:hypothetical protein
VDEGRKMSELIDKADCIMKLIQPFMLVILAYVAGGVCVVGLSTGINGLIFVSLVILFFSLINITMDKQ